MFQQESFSEGFENLNAAIEKFENYLYGEGSEFISEDEFVRIAEFYEDSGKLDMAVKAVNVGMERFPYYLDLQIKKVGLLNAKGLFDLSLKLLEQITPLSPHSTEYYIYKIDAYLGGNRYLEAVDELWESESIFKGEERSEYLLALSEVFEDWEELDLALDCLVFILKKDPRFGEALHRINGFVEGDKNCEKSIQLHQFIVDETPYNPQAWFNLGYAYQEMKLYEKAIDAYEYVLVIDENFEFVRRNIADAYIGLRNYDKAIETLEVCLRKKEESTLYEALGYCYERKRKYEYARTSYRLAIELNPEDDILYYKLGKSFTTEKLWKKALPYLHSAVNLNFDEGKYHLLLGECYARMEEYDQAIDQYMVAIELKPTNSTPRLALGKLLYDLECYEEALQQINAAILEARFTIDYYYYKCVILLALGKKQEALLELEAGLSESPARSKILFDLNPELSGHLGIMEVLSRYK